MTTVLIILGLLLAAMALFLLEICTPSFGVLAAMGIAALAGAVWQAFTISGLCGGLTLAGVLVGTPAYVVALVRVLPRTPLGRRLFLRRTEGGAGEAVPESRELQDLVGRIGTAETPLRPSGAVRFDRKRIIALAEGGLIEKGSTVKAVRVSGTNLIVRKQGPREFFSS